MCVCVCVCVCACGFAKLITHGLPGVVVVVGGAVVVVGAAGKRTFAKMCISCVEDDRHDKCYYHWSWHGKSSDDRINVGDIWPVVWHAFAANNKLSACSIRPTRNTTS